MKFSLTQMRLIQRDDDVKKDQYKHKSKRKKEMKRAVVLQWLLETTYLKKNKSLGVTYQK